MHAKLHIHITRSARRDFVNLTKDYRDPDQQHAICTAAEETQEEWKEQRLGPRENVTDLDASSKLSIISFEAKKELRILHSAKISNIIDEFTVRRKISGEGEKLETGRYLMEFWHIIPSNLLFPAMVSWLGISS
jgi:hypothetical protein